MSDSSGAFSEFLRSLNEPEEAADRSPNNREEQDLLIEIQGLFDRAMVQAFALHSIMQSSEEEGDKARVREQLSAQLSAQKDLYQSLTEVRRALHNYEKLYNAEPDEDLLLLTDQIRGLYSFVDGDTMSPDRLREFRNHINATRESFARFMSKQKLGPSG